MKRRCGLAIILFAIFVMMIAVPAQAAKPIINCKTASIQVGKTIKLKVNGYKGSIKWSTSNKNVASVSNGNVKGLKEGKAAITASCGRIKLTCSVTVKNPAKSVWYSYSLYRGGQPDVNGNSKFNYIYIKGQKLIVKGDLWTGTNLKRSKHLANKTRSFKISNKTKIYYVILKSNHKYEKQRISLSKLLEENGFSREDHIGYDTDFHVQGDTVTEIRCYWS